MSDGHPVPAQNPVTLAFQDAQLEAEYLATRSFRLKTLTVAVVFPIILWIAIVPWAFLVMPADAHLVAENVLGFHIPVLVTAVVACRLVAQQYQARAVAVANIALFMVIGLAQIRWQLLGGEDLQRYSRAVMAFYLLWCFSFANAHFKHRLLCTWLLVGAWLAATLLFHPFALAALVDNVVWLGSAQLSGTFIAHVQDRQRRRIFMQRRWLEEERARSNRLLRNMLPNDIADRLKLSESRIAEHFPSATVIFGDLVGFTSLSEALQPTMLVEMLDEIFSKFDTLAEEHGLEKIKTIGDAYMIVGGVPQPRADHAPAAARMALAMRDFIDAYATPGGGRLSMRIGIHTGPVVAGVIGKKKFTYDLWGDTVNTASRMESHGQAGRIHISEETRSALGAGFLVEERGTIDVKGKGQMHTYWLDGLQG